MNKYSKQSATVNDVGRLWKSTQHSYRQFTDITTPFSRNFPGQKYQVPRFSRNRCIFPDFSSAIFPRLTVSRHCKQHLTTHVTGTCCYWLNCTNKRPNLTWLTTLLKCLDVPTKVGLLLVNRHNWRAPWKNRISSTTMKLRKSLVKPVMRPNISSCLVLPPEIVMYDAFNERPPIYASTDICVVVHDDTRWKNRTTRYNCRFSAVSLALQVIFVRRKRALIYALCMIISGGRTKQHVIIGFGELAAVD